MLQLILEPFFFPQALIYVSFVLISCALFSKFWIEASMLRGQFSNTTIARLNSRGLKWNHQGLEVEAVFPGGLWLLSS